MGTLGDRYAVGVTSPNNRIVSGGWVITFPQQVLPAEDFEMWHGSTKGPGGYFEMWIDDKLYGVGQNGRINEYCPSGPAMYVRKGQELSLHWSITTGDAPKAWIFLRTPEIGRI